MKEKLKGDRLVQIILLVLIALGIATFPIMLSKKSNGPGGRPGPGGPGGPGGPQAPTDQEESNAKAVEVSTVSLSTVQEYIKVNGDVDSTSSVSIYPDVSGKLSSINVSVGDLVTKGQTVATVDPSQLGQVYSKSSVKSTVKGTITSINYDEGETVGTSTAIVNIGNLEKLTIVTYIPERYVNSVKKGLNASFTLDAYPTETFNATVTEVSPVLDSKSRSQKISLTITNKDPRIKVGMFASIRLVVKEAKDTITIPKLALTSYYDEDVVYVVKEDNTVERRSVKIGLSSSDYAQITEGLTTGEVVVVRGLSTISDGSTIRIVE
ncbi:efflux RND transporter periplasmic adaptor subunit [Spirochaeta cellobiosiphila]|uniref:efflux RND transporter periplasmic adaptor subunit n=1 Tax=Spirochaeta cellobiosiphila TaxID=504483 RepID=UPI000418C9CA|nr:efflux RND transporter periplasmic adaptor subunit [Spirochaeta cellobiosiphila]